MINIQKLDLRDNDTITNKGIKRMMDMRNLNLYRNSKITD
jgi:hypothetical protein